MFHAVYILARIIDVASTTTSFFEANYALLAPAPAGRYSTSHSMNSVSEHMSSREATRQSREQPKVRVPSWRATFGPLAAPFNLVQICTLLIVVATYLVEFFERGGCLDRGAWVVTLWTATMGGFLMYPALLRRPLIGRERLVPYIAGRLVLCVFAVWLARGFHLSSFLLYVVVVEALLLDRRVGVITGAWATVAFATIAIRFGGVAELGSYLDFVVWFAGLIFIGGTTMLMVREQEARAHSEQLVRELTAAHQQIHELATTEERNRLAREIHDSLGHYLTVINIQLEKAQLLRARDAQRADQAVGDAKRLADEALADVRRSVAALQPTALDELPIELAIRQHIATFREHSGIAVSLLVDGNAEWRSEAAGHALYRAVQEGLTNVRKHAAATTAAVTLRFEPTRVELCISDNGRGIPVTQQTGTTPPSGFGLAGLRDRVSALGGSLEIGPGAQGGTLLRLHLPTDQTA